MLQADGEGLLHHHGDTARGAGFHDAEVIERIGEDHDRLRAHLVEHPVEIREEDRGIQAESLLVPGRDRLIGLGHADQPDIRTLEVSAQEPAGVAVDEARHAEPQGLLLLPGVRQAGQQQEQQAQHD